MLQGQGGDELFWGYPALRETAFLSLEKQAGRPGWLTRPESRTRAGLMAWARDLGGLRSARQRRDAPPDRMVFYDRLNDYRAAAAMPAHYSAGFAARVDAAGAASLFTFARPWPDVESTITRLVCDTYLRGNGIAQGDRLSMASGVELRLPLVDHRLVETVIGLRKRRSDLGLPPKTLLRESVRDLLPAFVRDRVKRGFTPPTHSWHRAIFAAHGASLIDGALVHEGVLRPESAAFFATGPFPDDATCPLSFKALVLEQWLRQMRSRGSD
jgi:asparagine synthase (glutamine-hydrolysing)